MGTDAHYGIMIDSLMLDKVNNSLWHFHNSCGCQPCRGEVYWLLTLLCGKMNLSLLVLKMCHVYHIPGSMSPVVPFHLSCNDMYAHFSGS